MVACTIVFNAHCIAASTAIIVGNYRKLNHIEGRLSKNKQNIQQKQPIKG